MKTRQIKKTWHTHTQRKKEMVPHHGRKRTSNIPLTFWRLRLRLRLQDFPTPRLHHWVLVLGFPVDMTISDRKRGGTEFSSLKSQMSKCHKLRCFSVSWHMQINLLYIVDPIHWVLYPLPSRRQLWAQKTHRITLRIPIIADVHVCGAYLLLGLFSVASDKIIIIIAKRMMQHKVLKRDVMSCVHMSDIMTESLANYQETSRLSAVFHLKTLAKLWKTDATLQSV